MTSHESRVTCLCARGGDGDVWDHLLHYLGCLQFRDRDNFFEDTNIFWEQEIQHQVQLGSDPLDAIKAVLDDRESWKIDCERELRRIDSLRKTLAADKTESHLVERLEESRLQWRKSEAYITGIDRARMSREESNTRDILPPIVDSRDYGPYEPEKDLNVDILQLENGKGTNVEDGRVRGTFPNQRTTIAKLLADINLEASLLHGDQRPGSIRYLHIPANNREWVEEIINRYLENKSSQNRHNHKSEIPEDTKGHTTLRESYWGDQLYDPRDVETPPIARHIRPSCTMVSASTDGAESSPENLTLFMPYLYWETSRKQNQFAAEIDYIMAEAEMRNSRLGVEDRVKPVKEGKMAYNSSLELDAVRSSNGQKGRTRKNLSWLRRVSNWTNKYNPIMLPRAKTPMIKPSWTNSLAKGSNSGKIRRQVNEEGHIQVRNPLGRYLLFASRLYESMENYRDKMLLRKHLLQELPIHPRRTLDHAARSVFDLNRQRDETQGLRPEHESSETLPTSQNIQKAPFVVMVDQLWMWILDENTIITCFPNQYGSNEDDESGVHKSIRIRLKNCGPDQIRSVFDLALIVIDECCNKLFDKITESKQTLKVDTIFADRIEVVVLKLVKWKRYRDVTGLDTSPKRKLEEELNDIVRKLQVILHIIENQKDILRKFVSNAEHMLNPIKISEQNKDGTTSRNLLELSRVDNGEHENGSKDTKREGDYYWFKKNADELYTKLDQRVKELETLRRRALRTAEYIKAFESLHTVKQQLINSDRKARPITICLVIVTIFFLPLSFLSAFFGMNNAYMPIKRSHDQDRPRLMTTIISYVFSPGIAFIFCALISIVILLPEVKGLKNIYSRVFAYMSSLKSNRKKPRPKVETLRDKIPLLPALKSETALDTNDQSQMLAAQIPTTVASPQNFNLEFTPPPSPIQPSPPQQQATGHPLRFNSAYGPLSSTVNNSHFNITHNDNINFEPEMDLSDAGNSTKTVISSSENDIYSANESSVGTTMPSRSYRRHPEFTNRLKAFVNCIFAAWIYKVPKQMVRVTWKCRCGKTLHIDVDKRDEQEAVSYAQEASGSPESVRVLSRDSDTKSDSSRSTESIGSTAGSDRNSIFSHDSKNSSQSSTSMAQQISPSLPQGTKRYLLLCVTTGLYQIKLAQIDVTNIAYDTTLYSKIRETYSEMRGALSKNILVVPKTVEYVKFELVRFQKSGTCVGNYETNSIPSIKEVIQQEYAFNPCPPRIGRLPIQPHIFMHSFLNPGDHSGSLAVSQLPKKVNEMLRMTELDNSQELPYGWGIFIVEGFNETLVAYIVLLVLSIILLVVVLWSSILKDISGGVGIGQFGLGFAAVLFPAAIITLRSCFGLL